jgi:diaminopimelate epimerase
VSGLRVLKGHGTENDFVLIPDLDGGLELTDDLVRALCDRHTGVGADGVLRVVRSEQTAEARHCAATAPYFMDYRNADGSIAEMCGNGVRVFARYLQWSGLLGEATAVLIATRGGPRQVELTPDGLITVEMGVPRLLDQRPLVTVPGLSGAVAGFALEIPNPHVVVEVADRSTLDGLRLDSPPVVEPALPTGQNVEFITRIAPDRLAMRVHERGVGETRSCGTGICAAAVSAAMTGGGSGAGGQWWVDVPGGTCRVSWTADGGVLLSGPAVLVAEIELEPGWLVAAGG